MKSYYYKIIIKVLDEFIKSAIFVLTKCYITLRI